MTPTRIVERDALAIHDRLLALDGGAPGVCDPGLLASALARPPQHHAYGDAPDIVRLAALYTHGIFSNHPFVDGNERVGFVVGVLTLELNACTFTAPQELDPRGALPRRWDTGLDGYERFLRDHARSADGA